MPTGTQIRKDESRHSKVRGYRFRMRVWRISGVLLALCVLVGLGTFAWKQRALVREQADVALARQLTAQSEFTRKEPHLLELSALLAAESLLRAPSAENEHALRQALELLPARSLRLKHQERVHDVSFSPDCRYLATAGGEGLARVFKLPTGRVMSQLRHAGAVLSVTFSPDGRYAATGSADGTAAVFEASDGKELWRTPNHGRILEVLFSPDGRSLATASEDGMVRLFRLDTGGEVWSGAHGSSVSSISFTPDGRYLSAAGGGKTARVYDALSGREVFRYAGQSGVTDAVLDPTGKYLATAGEDGTVRLFLVGAWKQFRELRQEGRISRLAFSEDAQYLATGSAEGVVCVFEVGAGRALWHFNMGSAAIMSGIVFSPDNRYVGIASHDKTARLFETSTGTEMLRAAHQGFVLALAFSPDGRYLATGVDDGWARMFDVGTAQDLMSLNHLGELSTPAAFSGDRRLAAVGTKAGNLLVFSVAENKEVLRRDMAVTAVALHPGGQFIAAADESHTLRMFNLPKDREKWSFKSSGKIEKMVFSPDGRYLGVTGQDRTIQVFNAYEGEEILRVERRSPVLALAFNFDGRYLAAAGADPSPVIFQLDTGEQAPELDFGKPGTAVALSGWGDRLATGLGDGTLVVTTGGKEVLRVRNLEKILALAFSPGGGLIAAGSSDKTARVFDLRTGQEILRRSHNDEVWGVHVTHEGELFATDGFGLVRRHLVNRSQLVPEVCSRITRNLTRDEWKQYLGDEPYRRTCPLLP
jgi:WD40 repeat protein